MTTADRNPFAFLSLQSRRFSFPSLTSTVGRGNKGRGGNDEEGKDDENGGTDHGVVFFTINRCKV